MRWVITREREDCTKLVAELRTAHVDAVCIPAIERQPLPWPSDLDVDGALFLTSAYAAMLALAHFGDVSKRKIAALSPSTLAAVEQLGARVDVAAEGGVVRLAEACVAASWRGDVVYPTSDAGLAQAEQHRAIDILDAAGCRVRRRAVYTTLPAASLDDDLRALKRSLDANGAQCVVVLYSPSAARAFCASAARTGLSVADYVNVGTSTARALATASKDAGVALRWCVARLSANDIIGMDVAMSKGKRP